MELLTDNDFSGFLNDHPHAEHWDVLGFNDNTFSLLPKGFFKTWDGKYPDFGKFTIQKCSAFGIGSTVKYDTNFQSLFVGRYVSGGENIRFILNGVHNMDTITTYMIQLLGLPGKPAPDLGNTILKNDIWIGDEAMIMGGVTIENGCVIGARSLITPKKILEPYGIYGGNPAKLIRHRFDERIIALLLEIAWWEKPVAWVRKNIDIFNMDLTSDIGKSLEMLTQLKNDLS